MEVNPAPDVPDLLLNLVAHKMRFIGIDTATTVA